VGGETTDDALESTQQQLPTPGPSEASEASGPSEEDTIHVLPSGYRQRGEKAPQDVNLDPTDTNLIILGKRNRKQKDLNNFAIQSYAVRLGPEPLVD
jgi:hypothetical protein